MTRNPGISPYPGLRAFNQNESHIFFGRDDQIDKLLEKLKTSHFVAVIGPSGCGKSSLVKAGLIPSLKTGFFLNVGTKWRILEMRPGNKPFYNLAVSINDSFDTDNPIELLIAELKRSPKGLTETLKSYEFEPDENFLLIIDQFEELFRYKQNDNIEEVTAFISLLIATSIQRDIPFHIVITMRSDFLGECSLFPGLPEILNDNQFLAPRLTREQTKKAIEGPAKVCGGMLTPQVVTMLLNDLGIDHDQLPILQHALMRMWNKVLAESTLKTENKIPNNESNSELPKKEKLTLDVSDYLAIGQLKNAITQHADEAYNELNEADKKIAEIIFKRLTERDSQQKDVRHPSQISDIAGVAKVSVDQVIEVAQKFMSGDCNFIVSTDRHLQPESFLDISHESIMRQWDRLKKWISEEFTSSDEYKRFNTTGELLRGADLANALEWQRTTSPNPEWAIRYSNDKNTYNKVDKYIQDSKAKEEQEFKLIEEETERKAKQLEKQIELTLAAEKAKDDAINAKKEAEIQRRKAIIAAFIAIIATIIILISGFRHYREDQLKHVEASKVGAQRSININHDFAKAYSYLKSIDSMKSKFFFEDSTKKKIDTLKSTLLFHVVTPNLIIDKNRIIYLDGHKLKVSKISDFTNQDTMTIIDRHISKWGFSKNASQYWKAYNQDPTRHNKSLIYKYVIKDNLSDKDNLSPDSILVDSTYNPTADYDVHGNLYYLKEGYIYLKDSSKSNSVPLMRIDSLVKIQKDSSKTCVLEFLPKEDGNPSDFLKVTVKDIANNQTGLYPYKTFIVDIVNKQCKEILQVIDCYVDQNKNLFYTQPFGYTKISVKKLGFHGKKDDVMPTGNENSNEYFVKILREKLIIKKLENPQPSISPDKKFTMSYIDKGSISLKSNKNDTNVKLVDKNDSIITFKALNNYFVFLHQNNKPNSKQFVTFETYDLKRRQEFNIPQNWSFYNFKDSIMVFKYSNKALSSFDNSSKDDSGSNLLGVFIMNSKMTQNGRWNDWYRLMDWLEEQNKKKN